MLRHAPTRKSVIMSVVVRLLVKWGATVERIYREERVTDLAPLKVEHDLYVLKSSTELALSLAGALQAMGANLLNPNPNSAIMRDKVAATSNAPSQLVLDVCEILCPLGIGVKRESKKTCAQNRPSKTGM